MKKTAFLLTLLFALHDYVSGQVDTLFWFAAPELTNGNFDQRVPPAPQTMDRPIQLRITAFAQPATVTITQPAGSGPGYMPPQVINVPAGGTVSHNLTPWIDSLECKPPDRVLNYGLKISSTSPVTIYYEIVSAACLCAPTIFVLKGQNALGTDFWIPSQNWVDNGYHVGTVPSTHIMTPPPYSSFDIVATENNTNVTITPSNPIVGHPANVPFVITLNRGQTYSATAAGYLPTDRLNGSRVTSDKPIAVTYKDDMLRDNSLAIFPGGCGDPGGDQLVPTPLLGTEYIAIKGNLDAPGDQLFILATQNNTDVFQNGTLVGTINAGANMRLGIPGTAGSSTFIQTSKPVSMLQLTGYGCEMDLALVPKNNCNSGSFDVSFVRAIAQPLFLHLTVPAGGQGNFLVNGTAGVITAGQFSAVPGSGGQWYAAWISLSASQYPAGSVIRVQNTSSRFHMGVFNGQNQTGAGGSRFGYFSNFGQIEAKASASANQVCSGETLQLRADTVSGATYTWTGPGGFSSTTQNPTINNVQPGASGTYTLTVDVVGCSSSSDTVNIRVYEYPTVSLGEDTSVCEKQIVLQPKTPQPTGSYLWSTMETTTAITVTQSGRYILTVSNNGCTSSDTINVDLNPSLSVELGPDTGICHTQVPLELYSAQPAGTSYEWSTGITNDRISVYTTGTYWLNVSRNGCVGTDTIHVEVVPEPRIDIGPDTIICEQYPHRIGTTLPGASYLWNTGATTPYIAVNQTGAYVLEANLRGCRVYDTIQITAMPRPDVDLGSDRDICADEVILLDATYGANSRYLWNTGDTSATLTVTKAGLYSVTVTSAFNCNGADSILLSYYPRPIVFLGADTTVCEETPLLLRATALNADSVRWSDGSYGNTLSIRYGGEYIATGINKCGTGADTIDVKQIFCEIWLPNAFTPNGDGHNDKFRILGNIARMEGVSFGIFNRWGEQVFFTENPREGWDGIHKGIPAQMGTYVYLLEYSIDSKPYRQTGNFHLLR
jgi:gliding motility-associated-like protein